MVSQSLWRKLVWCLKEMLDSCNNSFKSLFHSPSSNLPCSSMTFNLIQFPILVSSIDFIRVLKDISKLVKERSLCIFTLLPSQLNFKVSCLQLAFTSLSRDNHLTPKIISTFPNYNGGKFCTMSIP